MDSKKKLIIIGGVVLLIVLIIVLLNLKTNNEVVLKTNEGVSYVWEYSIDNDDIVEYTEKESIDKKKRLVGGEIEEHYVFKGKKAGTTTITFDYRNFVDNTIDKTKKYKVKVNKRLQVDIKEIK